MHSIQHYVIKFVSDLWQIGGFLRALRFPLLIKLTATEILLKVALNTTNPLYPYAITYDQEIVFRLMNQSAKGALSAKIVNFCYP